MISNPIKGYKNVAYPKGSISQGFGENPELYMAACKMKSHNGIDIVAPWRTPLYAVEDGKVCEAKTDPSGYGRHVRFLSASGLEWTYGHLEDIMVKVGDDIKVGQQIGTMGNTGFVVSNASPDALGYWVGGSNKHNGTHLHLSCRKFKYNKKGWSYYPNTPKMTIIDYNNGWNGCFDFKDMFNEIPEMGDIQILKRQIENIKEDDWWTKLLTALKFLSQKQ